MTPEGKVKGMIKRKLGQIGAYHFMPVQNGMGAPGLDFYCCYNGYFFAIEAKAPGRKTTDQTIQSIVRAGGEAFVVDGEAAMLLVLEWVKRRAPDESGVGGVSPGARINRGESTL